MKQDYMSQADLVSWRIQNGIGLKDTETALKCAVPVHG